MGTATGLLVIAACSSMKWITSSGDQPDQGCSVCVLTFVTVARMGWPSSDSDSLMMNASARSPFGGRGPGSSPASDARAETSSINSPWVLPLTSPRAPSTSASASQVYTPAL